MLCLGESSGELQTEMLRNGFQSSPQQHHGTPHVTSATGRRFSQCIRCWRNTCLAVFMPGGYHTQLAKHPAFRVLINLPHLRLGCILTIFGNVLLRHLVDSNMFSQYFKRYASSLFPLFSQLVMSYVRDRTKFHNIWQRAESEPLTSGLKETDGNGDEFTPLPTVTGEWQ